MGKRLIGMEEFAEAVSDNLLSQTVVQEGESLLACAVEPNVEPNVEPKVGPKVEPKVEPEPLTQPTRDWQLGDCPSFSKGACWLHGKACPSLSWSSPPSVLW